MHEGLCGSTMPWDIVLAEVLAFVGFLQHQHKSDCQHRIIDQQANNDDVSDIRHMLYFLAYNAGSIVSRKTRQRTGHCPAN